MSGAATADAAGCEALRRRLDAGLRRIAFFVVPSAVAFLALGDVIAAALLQTGRFRHDDAVYVWGILAGSAVGLLASTLGRLYSSTYYALRDTRTPLRYALVRVVADDRARLPVRDSAAALAGRSRALGRRRTDRVGRHRGLGRDAAAAADAERAHRPDRTAGSVTSSMLWLAALPARPRHGRSSSRCRSLHPIVAAVVVLGPYGSCSSASRCCGCRHASAVVRAVGRIVDPARAGDDAGPR